EAADSPGRIYAPVAGNTVRDQLDRGYRLGVVGSGDSHDGHPGLAHLVTGQGGLAGIFAEEATRAAVLEALRARRVYATNGPRIYLRTVLAERPMGAQVPVWRGSRELVAEVAGTAPIEWVEVVRSGEVVERVGVDGLRQARLALEVRHPRPGEYLYLRVIQEDGGVAWSSAYFFDR
ncbi:MAG: DUF3604 domain-containing protein, partial [Thermoanaerobaculia bacterium]|nr:DUF3604 domain-containing protein [Thermoanaerobaculia bacterium]